MRWSGRRFLISSILILLTILILRFLIHRIVVYLPILIISDTDALIKRTQTTPQQDGQTEAFAYSAGMHMAGLQPRNRSYCTWHYGLPDVLSYPASKITWTPEIGEKSPYRVLPFVLRGTEDKEKLPQVTLCTHATADQAYGILELAQRWEGPLTLAIFTPGLDAGIAVALLDRACRCEPEMYKVAVHFIFPAGRPPALGQLHRSQGDCAASDLQRGDRETERTQRNMVYPINVARNVARSLANTTQVLVSDIELLPSDRLASGFMHYIRSRSPKTGVVFVVPVFEIESNEQPPRTKRELLLATKAGVAVYFHRYLCSHCQRFPQLTRWLMKPDPGKVRPLIFAKREFPHHRWEPLFIGTKDDPFYAEEMSWEGKQDKMSQMFEMCLLNYRLVILDGAFLVHTPGIKRKAMKIDRRRQDFFKIHERKNARIYQRTTKQLLKRHPANRRCAP